MAQNLKPQVLSLLTLLFQFIIPKHPVPNDVVLNAITSGRYNYHHLDQGKLTLSKLVLPVARAEAEEGVHSDPERGFAFLITDVCFWRSTANLVSYSTPPAFITVPVLDPLPLSSLRLGLDFLYRTPQLFWLAWALLKFKSEFCILPLDSSCPSIVLLCPLMMTFCSK